MVYYPLHEGTHTLEVSNNWGNWESSIFNLHITDEKISPESLNDFAQDQRVYKWWYQDYSSD